MKKPAKPSNVVDEYIARFPEETGKRLQLMREAIRSKATGAEECICYGIPTFTWRGKNLVHFAAWKEHIGFYPTSSGIKAFQTELGRFEVSRGTVRFPNEERLPTSLIKRITAFRLLEVRGAR
ncbi:MAG: DUF1801 domain-containing protein [Kiritimatiellia bacterium]